MTRLRSNYRFRRVSVSLSYVLLPCSSCLPDGQFIDTGFLSTMSTRLKRLYGDGTKWVCYYEYVQFRTLLVAALLVAASSYANDAINLQAVAVLSVARKRAKSANADGRDEDTWDETSTLQNWQKSRFDGRI
jgi:hypothetical protein